MKHPNQNTALLISPGPIDGYPPVQHQARILARAGYKVTLLTSTLSEQVENVEFNEPRVDVIFMRPQANRRLDTLKRALFYIKKIRASRKIFGNNHVEISYDPLGLFYSDITPFKPKLRIAHLHERLQELGNRHLETRLIKKISGFKFVVVPDYGRGETIKSQLKNIGQVLVVENYPMLCRQINAVHNDDATMDSISVVYCGTIGTHQKLEEIIESVKFWKSHVNLVLVGNDTKPVGQSLHKLVTKEGLAERVRFLGWQSYDNLTELLGRHNIGIALFAQLVEQLEVVTGASNKRYEYMRSGLTQIGDMSPGVSELLEGQEIGLCVKTHAPKEIARVVNLYANNQERMKTEGKKAYQLHKEKYNYEKVFQPVLNIIDNELQ